MTFFAPCWVTSYPWWFSAFDFRKHQLFPRWCSLQHQVGSLLDLFPHWLKTKGLSVDVIPGFVHCSSSPRGAGLCLTRSCWDPTWEKGMGIWGQHSPPYRDIIASEPQISSVWGRNNQFLPCLSWQNTKKGFCPAGIIYCSHWAAQYHPGWDWQGLCCRIWDFSSGLTHLPGAYVCCKRDT